MLDGILDSNNFFGILAFIGGGVLSFLIGMMMERYKNRRLELTYTISSQQIGIPADSFLPGDLSVKYNGNTVNSLFLYKLLLKNNSNFDGKDLPLSLYTDVNSYILSYSYPWVPNTTSLLEGESYSTRVQKYINEVSPIFENDPNSELPEPLLSEGLWLHRNRQLNVSSLNRKEEIELSILVGSQVNNHQSGLYLQVSASGVLLKESKNPVKENERIARISILIGIAITVLFGIYFTLTYQSQYAQFVILTVIGALNFFIGIYIYRIISFIHSYFK